MLPSEKPEAQAAFSSYVQRIFGSLSFNRNNAGHSGSRRMVDNDTPLRDELLSIQQLEQYAADLARQHVVSNARHPEKLLPRLNENEEVIGETYRLVSQIVRDGVKPPPAGEWLLDNYYIVREHIQLAREHLPRKFSRELPVLAGGSGAGFPRIFHLAIEFISHTDGRVDEKILSQFVTAYQSETHLRVGELWAIPIMLRLALLENLRRVSQRIASARLDCMLAGKWSERLIMMAKSDPKNLVVILAEMAQAQLPQSSAFVAELCRSLQGQDPSLALALSWFDQRLFEAGLTSEQLILAEGQGQAADQVTIGNTIGSMRLLSVIDWRAFVEEHSQMERILRSDPAGLHALSDFETRDACRHAVEAIAKKSRASEADVAEKAIAFARAGAEAYSPADRRGHAGYYLIDRGLTDLARAFHVKAKATSPAVSVNKGWRLFGFLACVALVTAGLSAPFAGLLLQWELQTWVVALLTAAFALCASQVGVALANTLVSALMIPQRLPRMDFEKGIPGNARTLVTVPTMLSSRGGVDSLIEGLEIRYLANRDANVQFSLLTDFPDAPQAEMPNDAALITHARTEIERLNRKYSGGNRDIFFLFHRPRLWNASEGAWMGRERKRGKLADLNHLLRGNGADHFSEIVGDMAALDGVRYVIPLDTDTQLPPNSARKLAATMAHILNQPVFDEKLGRIVAGYGLLQPRVALNLKTARLSWFVRIFAPDAGIDPYTRTVSDVYQDLFGEGSFVGKGIYDVDAFEKACGTRFPDNRILSHDLIEGCYSRSGLVSDVELFEDFPSRFNVDARRRHRWMRGDWQIASWLLPWVPTAVSRAKSNTLSALSRWKIFDNLRRSVIAPVSLVLLAVSWLVLPQVAFELSIALAALAFIPVLVSAGLGLIHKPRGASVLEHVFGIFRDAMQGAVQSALGLMFLAFEAVQAVDAIARTFYRMILSRKKLLEWQTASDSERKTATDPAGFYREMSVSVALTVALTIAIFVQNPAMLALASPWLLGWVMAPAVAWWTSRSHSLKQETLVAADAAFLHELSRRTWRFFETFVNAEENWLPPDNFQEAPKPVIAHRTSPTNMGAALLSTLAARDFGYLSLPRLIERLRNTITTLERLPRFKGHFYNWYDTHTLQPLLPMYVSSVDSGNLLGHLLVLRAGLKEMNTQPLLPRGAKSLADSVLCLRTALADAAHSSQSSLNILNDYQVRTNALCDRLMAHSGAYTATASELKAVAREVEQLTQQLTMTYPDSDIAEWCGELAKHRDELVESLEYWTPWLDALPQELRELPSFGKFDAKASLKTLNDFCNDALNAQGDFSATRDQLVQTRTRIMSAQQETENLAHRAGILSQMKFDFLYDEERKLLSIGYNASDNRLDNSFYDLLASEARLASYVCIAQGQLPQEHWFLLGRNVTRLGSGIALLSWSGSMFEYLMPALVMPSYEGSLLDQTCRAVIDRQREYARTLGTPWGISESGYNAHDINHNYQYRAFGVPGLGFKRGLSEDSVIAPYACIMSVMFAPQSSCENLREMQRMGAMSSYGFYEAMDFTPSRLAYNKSHALIQSYMAHHQGMAMLALTSFLLDRPMQRRFLLDPELKAVELLLQERTPKSALPIHPHSAEEVSTEKLEDAERPPVREFRTAGTTFPHVQLLSNGRYHVMVTNAGTGYSRWKDMAVTRWQEDAVADCLGQFCYLRDRASGSVWSTAHQPIGEESEEYFVTFTHPSAEFHRVHRGIASHETIFVSPENDVEIRRLKLSNKTRTDRRLDLTTYAEVVLNGLQADSSHPAFSKLFIQTEILPERRAILCTRRTRGGNDTQPWMFHLIAAREHIHGAVSYETDRARFIGRGKTLRSPQALDEDSLSGTAGSVLDPIASIRVGIDLEPAQSITLEIVTGVAESREAALTLISRFSDYRLCDRAFEVAWTNSRVALTHLNITEADAHAYSTLASPILFALPAFRADTSVLTRNRRGQSGVWGYGISGDVPIVLLRVTDTKGLALAREALNAHAFLRMKGLAFDLVIWNEDGSTYRQALHDELMGLVLAGPEAGMMDQPGGVFIRRGDLIPEEDRVLLQAMARVNLMEGKGTLAEQLTRSLQRDPVLPRLVPTRPPLDGIQDKASRPGEPLEFYNGHGGFAKNGKEYVIHLKPDRNTPAPWCNVLANPTFGTVISEQGSAYTWFENAREFRLTPWHNDPVCDTSGEALYIRDEETGRIWSPTPWPMRGNNPYVVRHGFGYSTFETMQDGLTSQLTVFVHPELPVKVAILKVRNESARRRKLSSISYVDWVLGDFRPKHATHVVTEVDKQCDAVFARNAFNTDFRSKIGFSAVNDRHRVVTGDRIEFIGRNSNLSEPAALYRTRLSGRVGAGLDPCTAMQTFYDLPEGREREIVFILGAANDAEQARHIVAKMFAHGAAQDALEQTREFWRSTLNAVQVKTQHTAVDYLVNGWLPYQVLASRVWARSGFYQSGGAYGFRDQLQDVLSLLHISPKRAREHILRCASRQFVDGDVQHWWHPPHGRGVRTQFSDDYLWLPYAVSLYVQTTGDKSILQERIAYLEGRQVKVPDEEAYYDLPQYSNNSVSIYEHCTKALRRGSERMGEHGLPLMGCGDWNDGMNRVGIHGRGESVWLAFFLYDILKNFAKLARTTGDEPFTQECLKTAVQLAENIEANAWDGKWYKRAYFDDGTPLGSSVNDECQIDSLPQSWAVLSGAGSPERATMAMQAVDERLVRDDAKIIQLFDPPFNKSTLDPGYIKAYLPGVRENGGQYTHGAIWTVMAMAEQGNVERAWELTDFLNPILHGDTPEHIEVYKSEPYVIAADVYGAPPHVGRGGWSWYTGSAGWMYRLLTESLLGLRKDGNVLRIRPRVPKNWTEYQLQYRFGASLYTIQIRLTKSKSTLSVDGVRLDDPHALPLVDDGQQHAVELNLNLDEVPQKSDSMPVEPTPRELSELAAHSK